MGQPEIRQAETRHGLAVVEGALPEAAWRVRGGSGDRRPPAVALTSNRVRVLLHRVFAGGESVNVQGGDPRDLPVGRIPSTILQLQSGARGAT